MGRRREFKGVAHGVVGSFVSRNNDVGGYWGIGKLYTHALRNNVHGIDIDLLARNMSPFGEEFRNTLGTYAELFLKHCHARRLASKWVVSARARIDFNLSAGDRRAPPQGARGDLFDCFVEIKDDLGHIHTAHSLGWCSPHDPRRESRSTRV